MAIGNSVDAALGPKPTGTSDAGDGPGHYRIVVDKLAAMHAEQPSFTTADLRRVRCRTLVLVSDDDEVRLDHAVAAYQAIPDAELAVIPDTSHGLLVEKPELCNQIIDTFLTADPIVTFAPIRRKARMQAPR